MKTYVTSDHEFIIDDDLPLTFGLKMFLRGFTYSDNTGARQYFVKRENGDCSINIDDMYVYIYKQEEE